MANTVHLTSPMELGAEICKALDMDDSKVQRIIIDVDASKSLVVVYIQMMDDGRLLSINWGAGFDGANVTVLGK